LPTAHVSAALIAAADLDWQRSHTLLNRALQLDPNLAAGHRGLGLLASLEGNFAASRKHFEKALAIDPLSAWTSLGAARNEYADHKFERALSMMNELIDREPGFALGYYYRALTLAYLGRHKDALADLKRSEFGTGMIATDQAWIEARAGNPKPAQALLDQRLPLWKANQLPPSAITIAAIAAGQLTLAAQSIEAYVNERAPEASSLQFDPRLDPIRGEPTIAAIIARLWPSSTRSLQSIDAAKSAPRHDPARRLRLLPLGRHPLQ